MVLYFIISNSFKKLSKNYLFVFLFCFITIESIKANKQNISKEYIKEIKQSFCNSLLQSQPKYKIASVKTFTSNKIIEDNEVEDQAKTFSLTEKEKDVIRSAFYQISRRTCIQFNELEYKPWYHADRWADNFSYIIILKSKKISGYSDNIIEGINQRSLLYITETALNSKVANKSRGMVMTQVLRFMGFREEHLRPDAPSYIKRIDRNINFVPNKPVFSAEQLQWPFDPESITIPTYIRDTHQLTIYCTARVDANIGAGQLVGLLTRWDAIKLNSMYCPKRVGYANPRLGPCVIPRIKIKT